MEKVLKVIWITGIYIILIIILYLVIIYKVEYEDVDYNKYLYFYECSDNLCTTDTKIEDYYSKYKCDKNCPFIKEIVNENVVILSLKNKEFIYNYIDSTILNDKYQLYDPIYVSDSLYGYIVKLNDKLGVIDINNKVIVDLNYQQIGTFDENNNLIIYNDEFIKARKNNQWGAISIKDGSVKVDFTYSYNYFSIE